MEKRYVSLVMAICLSGALLLLTVLLLSSAVAADELPPAVEPEGVPDLVIDARAVDETILANQPITYLLLYTNTLAQQLTDVVITGTLSVQQYYNGAFQSEPIIDPGNFFYTGTFDSGYLLVWHLGTISPNALGRILFTTTVPPEAEPPWNDNERWPLLGLSAVITTSTPGVSTGNPQGMEGDTVTVMVVGPVLQADKTPYPNPVRPGRLLTYTLWIRNKDREDAITANDLVIADPVPANTTFHSASGTGTYSPTSGLVIWHPPDPLERGETMAVTFTVRVTRTPPTCPPQALINQNYTVQSAETIRTVVGQRRDVGIDDVLEKTIVTPNPPPHPNQVFPNQVVTYTLAIYNPLHDQPLTALRVTDTLPGEPNLFTYIEMLEGPAPLLTYPELVWDNLTISAGDVLTLAFRAQVPAHIDVATWIRTYYNRVSASSPDVVICDMADIVTPRAEVIRQIEMNKVVEPTHAMSGEVVTYTLTLQNLGATDIGGVRLTDTLPYENGGNFRYLEMVSGPEPLPGFQRNPVVWDNLSLPASSVTTLVFRAVAAGTPLQYYTSDLFAYSPETTIPERLDRAAVLIDPPLVLAKTVDPAQTFTNDTVDYEISVCNVATETYAFDRLQDYLPTGFYVGGANPLDVTFDPPVSLAPGACWSYPFVADVTIDVGCSTLPRTFWNSQGNVRLYLVSPFVATLVNAENLAPLLVEPHVTILKDRDHIAVLPGETFVYTITLDNASPVPVNNITIVDTLPNNFEFVEMVEGDPPDQIVLPNVTWHDQSVPAETERQLVLRVLVPPDTPLGNYVNVVNGSTTDLACIKGTGYTAQVSVLAQLILMSKYVQPAQVPPLGVVRYDIRLYNYDSVPIPNVTVTETLPGPAGDEFEFLGMVPGDPEPDVVSGRRVIWRDLTVPPQTTLQLRFDARASLLFGSYDNNLVASCPRTPIEPNFEQIRATVTVLPGVVLYKTVVPTTTVAGGMVVYTITLNNQSTNDLLDILITDTLPMGFSYRRMLEGPTPIRISPQVVWELGRLNRGQVQRFIFEALVGVGVISGTYYNNVNGYSPSAVIPGTDETAPVYVRAIDAWRVYMPMIFRGSFPTGIFTRYMPLIFRESILVRRELYMPVVFRY